MSLTSRELIQRIMSGQKVDTIPVDIGATEFTGITADAYSQIKAEFLLTGGHTRVNNPFANTVRVERSLSEKLNVDGIGFYPEPLRWQQGELSTGEACFLPERWITSTNEDGIESFRHTVSDSVFVRSPRGAKFNFLHPPLEGCKTAQDLDAHLQTIAFFDWTHHADEKSSQFGVRAEALRENSNAACVLNIRARLIGGAFDLRGPTLKEDFTERPELVKRLLELLTDTYIARLTDVLPEVAPHADLIAMREGGAYSITADIYRTFFAKHHTRIREHIAKTTELPVIAMLKNLKADIAQELINIGFDGIGLGVGSSPLKELREKLGPDVLLWGSGHPAAEFMDLSPEATQDLVDKIVCDAGGVGRFVFAFNSPLEKGITASKIKEIIKGIREAD